VRQKQRQREFLRKRKKEQKRREKRKTSNKREKQQRRRTHSVTPWINIFSNPSTTIQSSGRERERVSKREKMTERKQSQCKESASRRERSE
jgi:hypothetical protein